MLVIRTGNNKMPVRIANREDPDQTAFYFFQNIFVRNSFSRVSNSLDPNQATHFVMPDLSPNWVILHAFLSSADFF